MRVCPTCGARYEAPAQYCQRDGVALRIEHEARDPYLGQKILGQFRLEQIIGSGGMGVVYSGWDEGLGRRVAVKILHRDLVTNRDVVARFHREAQIAHQLDHPNIVRLILFGQLPDGNLYLVLEYLEGPTLLQALDRDGAFPPARAVKVCASVSDAIGYAHRRDIVHRDLKPENIMLVQRDGDVDYPKVLDFGIAKMLIGGDTLVTQAGLIFGTARYISPEGAQGDPVDRRSDVYSLGIITYQMLTGVTPFDSAEPVQLLLKHIHEQPAPVRSHVGGKHVPPALEAVVMRAIAKSAAARYGDGTAFAKALRDALAESDPHSAIRSVIPTTSMPMFVEHPNGMSVPASVVATAVQSPVFPTSSAAQAAAEGGSGVRLHPNGAPNTMLAGSPAQGPRVHPAMVPAASSGSHRAMQVHPYPVAALPSAPGSYAPVADMEPASGPRRSGFRAFEAPPNASTERVAAITHGGNDPDDDFAVPGLPRRARKRGASGSASGGPSPAGRTVLVVIASVIFTVGLGTAVAWGLGLFPSQRREAEVRDLTARAEEAFHAQRYVHQSDERDVEDLTDALLTLSPGMRRAQELRAASAVTLRNQAVDLRNGGHADQAVPLLRSAVRLSDDREIRDLLTQIEHEALNPPPVVPANAPPLAVRPPHPAMRPHPPAEHDDPLGPVTPVQAVPTVPSGPTFTPGRDPNVHEPAHEPAHERQRPVVGPAAPLPMQGGPSQPDPTPANDPNAGGQAF